MPIKARAIDRIVLAYSGGLETSVAIAWLADHYRAQIVTVTLDIGQGGELAAVRERALAIGAARAHVIDAREQFARDFVLPALQAGAIHDGRNPLAIALSRPLIAKHAVAIAHIEGATAIAHGCSGSGDDGGRLDACARALDPSLTIVAPSSVWGLTRAAAIEYARQRGIPVTVDGPCHVDANLWGRSIEFGPPDDPWHEPPESLYLLTSPPGETPDRPAYVEIEFDRGVPVRINGVALSLVELISSLETIAGAHGVGRIDRVAHESSGITSRTLGEAPAAIALHAAHQELQALVTPRDLEKLTSSLGVTYADLIDSGLWFTPTREAIDALVKKVQETVTGVVRLRFFKGDCRVVGRKTQGTDQQSVAKLSVGVGSSPPRPAEAGPYD